MFMTFSQRLWDKDVGDRAERGDFLTALRVPSTPECNSEAARGSGRYGGAGLTCFSSGFWHVLRVSVGEHGVPRVPAVRCRRHHRPRHGGRQHERPLVVVLETVCFRHAVVHIKVRGERDLLLLSRRHRLLLLMLLLRRPATRQPLLALAGGRRAPLRVRTRLGAGVREGPEGRDVGLPVGADVGPGGEAGTWREGLLEHAGSEEGVAALALLWWGDELVGPHVALLEGAGLALDAGRVGGGQGDGGSVGQRDVSALGVRADGALPVLGVGEGQVVGAVPLGAAGFGEVPRRAALVAVCPIGRRFLLPLPLPAL